MRVIRTTDYVFTVELTIDELDALKDLCECGKSSLENKLNVIITDGLLGSDKSEPESEDVNELEGKNEGIRRG